MSGPDQDPTYARLLLLVGEISADVKNLLTRHAATDKRLDRLEDRQVIVNTDIQLRLELLEKMRGKLLGIAWAVPIVIGATITIVGIALRYV